jgi:hypothetical protein
LQQGQGQGHHEPRLRKMHHATLSLTDDGCRWPGQAGRSAPSRASRETAPDTTRVRPQARFEAASVNCPGTGLQIPRLNLRPCIRPVRAASHLNGRRFDGFDTHVRALGIAVGCAFEHTSYIIQDPPQGHHQHLGTALVELEPTLLLHCNAAARGVDDTSFDSRRQGLGRCGTA